MNMKLIVILIYFIVAIIHIMAIIEDIKKDIKYMKERLENGR